MSYPSTPSPRSGKGSRTDVSRFAHVAAVGFSTHRRGIPPSLSSPVLG